MLKPSRETRERLKGTSRDGRRAEKAGFNLGHGPRSCLWKDITVLEIIKFVAAVFQVSGICDYAHTCGMTNERSVVLYDVEEE